jgi:hypothetical protein
MILVVGKGEEDISGITVAKEKRIHRLARWYVLAQRSCRGIAEGIEPLHGRHICRVVHGHDDGQQQSRCNAKQGVRNYLTKFDATWGSPWLLSILRRQDPPSSAITPKTHLQQTFKFDSVAFITYTTIQSFAR